MSTLKHYKWDLLVTAIVFLAFGLWRGGPVLATLAILAILEISFSFDNAVVNAKVLQRMSAKWQVVFMTVGILFAVGFMRFVFPILVVALTAHLGFGRVVDLAIHNPQQYATHLENAHGQIAMFGGVFLLLIFLNWVFEEKDVQWLRPLERVLERVGKVDMIAPIIVVWVIVGISLAVGGGHELSLLLAGVASLGVYLAVNSFANVFEEEDESGAVVKTGATGIAALGLFVYLEVQDMAFSFDGVSGAFAITDQVVLIMAGLGIGAIFVRSMTVQLLRSGQLAKICYLDHGAHWAIGSLAVCLLAETKFAISDYITGLIGVCFIAAAVYWSKAHPALEDEDETPAVLLPEPVPTKV